MRPMRSQPSPTAVILTLAEIKATIEAFDRGDANVFDAVDAIIVTIEAHRAGTVSTAGQEQRQQDAA